MLLYRPVAHYSLQETRYPTNLHAATKPLVEGVGIPIASCMLQVQRMCSGTPSTILEPIDIELLCPIQKMPREIQTEDRIDHLMPCNAMGLFDGSPTSDCNHT